MRELSTEIEINALPEQVWAVLCDFESYSEWNDSSTRRGFEAMNTALKARVEGA
jgi:hypothetical protein